MHRPAQRDDTQVQDGMKSGFVCMLYAGFAGVEHTQGMALNWVECWLVLAALLTLESPTPAVRAWGIRVKRSLFYCALLFFQCPTSAKPMWGIKGIKAAGIKQRVILLASLFL